MKMRTLQQAFKVTAFTSAALLALSAPFTLHARAGAGARNESLRRDADKRGRDDKDDRRRHDRDDDDANFTGGLAQIATGQFITPTALDDSSQQPLNPGLASYPNFVAGMAVRSQLSPDGTTLAILTAGQNSLYKPDGVTVDAAASTQFIFLFDVSGANKAHPLLKQVIQQVNAHVGLVFAHDGNTLYAAGGNDDAVYVYTKSGGTFVSAGPIAL